MRGGKGIRKYVLKLRDDYGRIIGEHVRMGRSAETLAGSIGKEDQNRNEELSNAGRNCS